MERGCVADEEERLYCGQCGAAVYNLEKHQAWHSMMPPPRATGVPAVREQGMTYARLKEIKEVVSWDSSPETITMRKWQVMEYLRECLAEIERCWKEEI